MVSFFVRSELFECGLDVDGTPVEGLHFYVVAEFEDGTRLASPRVFVNRGDKSYNPDGEPYWPQIENAESEATRYLAHVEAHSRKVTPSYDRLSKAGWDRIEPAYGSVAYQKEDAAGYIQSVRR